MYISVQFCHSFISLTLNHRASGGELLDVLTRQTHVTEAEIAYYIRQILWGIEHMHHNSYAHLGLTVS